MDDKVYIYEARYGHIEDPWEYYPVDQVRPGIVDVLNNREITEVEIKYHTLGSNLSVRWRKRLVSEDEAYELENDWLNFIANER